MREPLFDQVDLPIGEQPAQGRRGETGVDGPAELAGIAPVDLVGDPGGRERLTLRKILHHPGDQTAGERGARRPWRLLRGRLGSLAAGRDLRRAGRGRLERLVMLGDRLMLRRMDRPLLPMKDLLLRVMRLLFAMEPHLRLQIRQHLRHGKL